MQRRRRLAGLPAGEVARVVLDAVAEAHLLEHLEVVHRALLEALRSSSLPAAASSSRRSRSSTRMSAIARLS
jgi:hypothetical protein